MPFTYTRHENHHRFARKVLWLEVAVTNNKSSVIAGYLSLLWCNNYAYPTWIQGCPSIIRSDRGSENSRIAYLQPFLRRHGTDSLAKEKSFQYGKSASNQVCINIYAMNSAIINNIRGLSGGGVFSESGLQNGGWTFSGYISYIPSSIIFIPVYV